MNICDSIKHLKLWMAKEPINKVRRQVAEWVKTSITHETRKKGHRWGVGGVGLSSNAPVSQGKGLASIASARKREKKMTLSLIFFLSFF